MQQLTPNIYVDTQFIIPVSGPGPYGCNPSFVVTSEGVVLIDTPALPTYALKWRDEISKRGEIKYIINTEYHPDHISGNYFFPGTVVAHEGVKNENLRFGPCDHSYNLSYIFLIGQVEIHLRRRKENTVGHSFDSQTV